MTLCIRIHQRKAIFPWNKSGINSRTQLGQWEGACTSISGVHILMHPNDAAVLLSPCSCCLCSPGKHFAMHFGFNCLTSAGVTYDHIHVMCRVRGATLNNTCTAWRGLNIAPARLASMLISGLALSVGKVRWTP